MDTATTMFLVPGLGLHVERIRYEHGFINGYLQDANREPYERSIYLLFKPRNIIEFDSFIQQEYKRKVKVIEEYDYDGGYVVMVYEFPIEYLFEYKLFLKGKFSKFREEYIIKLPQLDSKVDADGEPFTEHSLQFMVCYKAKALKDYWEKKLDVTMNDDDEYWSVPVIEKETLFIDKIREDDKRASLSKIGS